MRASPLPSKEEVIAHHALLSAAVLVPLRFAWLRRILATPLYIAFRTGTAVFSVCVFGLVCAAEDSGTTNARVSAQLLTATWVAIALAIAHACVAVVAYGAGTLTFCYTESLDVVASAIALPVCATGPARTALGILIVRMVFPVVTLVRFAARWPIPQVVLAEHRKIIHASVTLDDHLEQGVRAGALTKPATGDATRADVGATDVMLPASDQCVARVVEEEHAVQVLAEATESGHPDAPSPVAAHQESGRTPPTGDVLTDLSSLSADDSVGADARRTRTRRHTANTATSRVSADSFVVHVAEGARIVPPRAYSTSPPAETAQPNDPIEKRTSPASTLVDGVMHTVPGTPEDTSYIASSADNGVDPSSVSDPSNAAAAATIAHSARHRSRSPLVPTDVGGAAALPIPRGESASASSESPKALPWQGRGPPALRSTSLTMNASKRLAMVNPGSVSRAINVGQSAGIAGRQGPIPRVGPLGTNSMAPIRFHILASPTGSQQSGVVAASRSPTSGSEFSRGTAIASAAAQRRASDSAVTGAREYYHAVQLTEAADTHRARAGAAGALAEREPASQTLAAPELRAHAPGGRRRSMLQTLGTALRSFLRRASDSALRSRSEPRPARAGYTTAKVPVAVPSLGDITGTATTPKTGLSRSRISTSNRSISEPPARRSMIDFRALSQAMSTFFRGSPKVAPAPTQGGSAPPGAEMRPRSSLRRVSDVGSGAIATGTRAGLPPAKLTRAQGSQKGSLRALLGAQGPATAGIFGSLATNFAADLVNPAVLLLHMLDALKRNPALDMTLEDRVVLDNLKVAVEADRLFVPAPVFRPRGGTVLPHDRSATPATAYTSLAGSATSLPRSIIDPAGRGRRSSIKSFAVGSVGSVGSYAAHAHLARGEPNSLSRDASYRSSLAPMVSPSGASVIQQGMGGIAAVGSPHDPHHGRRVSGFFPQRADALRNSGGARSPHSQHAPLPGAVEDTEAEAWLQVTGAGADMQGDRSGRGTTVTPVSAVSEGSASDDEGVEPAPSTPGRGQDVTDVARTPGSAARSVTVSACEGGTAEAGIMSPGASTLGRGSSGRALHARPSASRMLRRTGTHGGAGTSLPATGSRRNVIPLTALAEARRGLAMSTMQSVDDAPSAIGAVPATSDGNIFASGFVEGPEPAATTAPALGMQSLPHVPLHPQFATGLEYRAPGGTSSAALGAILEGSGEVSERSSVGAPSGSVAKFAGIFDGAKEPRSDTSAPHVRVELSGDHAWPAPHSLNTVAGDRVELQASEWLTQHPEHAPAATESAANLPTPAGARPSETRVPPAAPQSTLLRTSTPQRETAASNINILASLTASDIAGADAARPRAGSGSRIALEGSPPPSRPATTGSSTPTPRPDSAGGGTPVNTVMHGRGLPPRGRRVQHSRHSSDLSASPPHSDIHRTPRSSLNDVFDSAVAAVPLRMRASSSASEHCADTAGAPAPRDLALPSPEAVGSGGTQVPPSGSVSAASPTSTGTGIGFAPSPAPAPELASAAPIPDVESFTSTTQPHVLQHRASNEPTAPATHANAISLSHLLRMQHLQRMGIPVVLPSLDAHTQVAIMSALSTGRTTARMAPLLGLGLAPPQSTNKPPTVTMPESASIANLRARPSAGLMLGGFVSTGALLSSAPSAISMKSSFDRAASRVKLPAIPSAANGGGSDQGDDEDVEQVITARDVLRVSPTGLKGVERAAAPSGGGTKLTTSVAGEPPGVPRASASPVASERVSPATDVVTVMNRSGNADLSLLELTADSATLRAARLDARHGGQFRSGLHVRAASSFTDVAPAGVRVSVPLLSTSTTHSTFVYDGDAGPAGLTPAAGTTTDRTSSTEVDASTKPHPLNHLALLPADASEARAETRLGAETLLFARLLGHSLCAWDFDVYAFARVSRGEPLLHLLTAIMEWHGMLRCFGIPDAVLTAFGRALEAQYLATEGYYGGFVSADAHVTVPHAYAQIAQTARVGRLGTTSPECHEQAGNAIDRAAQQIEASNNDLHTVPYHGNIHGADVLQTTHTLLATGRLRKHVTALERLCILIAAAAHDVGHAGVNNDFLIASESEYALMHNDASPLENMHAYTLFSTLRQPHCNVLATLDTKTHREARALIIRAVLATDLKTHAEKISKLQAATAAVLSAQADLERSHNELAAAVAHAKAVADAAATTARTARRPSLSQVSVVSGDGAVSVSSAVAASASTSQSDAAPTGAGLLSEACKLESAGAATASLESAVAEYKHAQAVLATKKRELADGMLIGALKLADISHPLKPWKLHAEWTRRCMREFFTQGDLEKALKIPVSALCDRTKVRVPQSQLGFMTYVVLPMFHSWADGLAALRSTLRTVGARERRQPAPRDDSRDDQSSSSASVASSAGGSRNGSSGTAALPEYDSDQSDAEADVGPATHRSAGAAPKPLTVPPAAPLAADGVTAEAAARRGRRPSLRDRVLDVMRRMSGQQESQRARTNSGGAAAITAEPAHTPDMPSPPSKGMATVDALVDETKRVSDDAVMRAGTSAVPDPSPATQHVAASEAEAAIMLRPLPPPADIPPIRVFSIPRSIEPFSVRWTQLVLLVQFADTDIMLDPTASRSRANALVSAAAGHGRGAASAARRNAAGAPSPNVRHASLPAAATHAEDVSTRPSLQSGWNSSKSVDTHGTGGTHHSSISVAASQRSLVDSRTTNMSASTSFSRDMPVSSLPTPPEQFRVTGLRGDALTPGAMTASRAGVPTVRLRHIVRTPCTSTTLVVRIRDHLAHNRAAWELLRDTNREFPVYILTTLTGIAFSMAATPMLRVQLDDTALLRETGPLSVAEAGAATATVERSAAATTNVSDASSDAGKHGPTTEMSNAPC